MSEDPGKEEAQRAIDQYQAHILDLRARYQLGVGETSGNQPQQVPYPFPEFHSQSLPQQPYYGVTPTQVPQVGYIQPVPVPQGQYPAVCLQPGFATVPNPQYQQPAPGYFMQSAQWPQVMPQAMYPYPGGVQPVVPAQPNPLWTAPVPQESPVSSRSNERVSSATVSERGSEQGEQIPLDQVRSEERTVETRPELPTAASAIPPRSDSQDSPPYDWMQEPEPNPAMQRLQDIKIPSAEHLGTKPTTGTVMPFAPTPDRANEHSRRVNKLDLAWASGEKYTPRLHLQELDQVVRLVTQGLPYVPGPPRMPNPDYQLSIQKPKMGGVPTNPVGRVGFSPDTLTSVLSETWDCNATSTRRSVSDYLNPNAGLFSTVENDIAQIRAQGGTVVLESSHAGISKTMSRKLISQQLMNTGRLLTDPEAISTKFVTTRSELLDMIRTIDETRDIGGLNPQASIPQGPNSDQKVPLVTLGISTFRTDRFHTYLGIDYNYIMAEVPPYLYVLQDDVRKERYPRGCRYHIPLFADRVEAWEERHFSIKELGSSESKPLGYTGDRAFGRSKFFSMSPLVISELSIIPFNLDAAEYIRFLYLSTVTGATFCIDTRALYQEQLRDAIKNGTANGGVVRLCPTLKEVIFERGPNCGFDTVVQMDPPQGDKSFPLMSLPPELIDFLRRSFVITWSDKDIKKPFIDTFGLVPVNRDDMFVEKTYQQDTKFFGVFDAFQMATGSTNLLSCIHNLHHRPPQTSVFGYAGLFFGQGGMPRASLFIARLMALIGRYPPFGDQPYTMAQIAALAQDIFDSKPFSRLYSEYLITLREYLAFIADMKQFQLRPRDFMRDLITKVQSAAKKRRNRVIELESIMTTMVIGEFAGDLRYDSKVFENLRETPSLVEYDVDVAARGSKSIFEGNELIYPLLDVLSFLEASIQSHLLHPENSQIATSAQDRQHLSEHKLMTLRTRLAEQLENHEECTTKFRQFIFRGCVENSLVLPVVIALSTTQMVQAPSAGCGITLLNQCQKMVDKPNVLLYETPLGITDPVLLTTINKITDKMITVIKNELTVKMFGCSFEEQQRRAAHFGLFTSAWNQVQLLTAEVFTHCLSNKGLSTAAVPVSVLWCLQRFYDKWLESVNFIPLLAPGTQAPNLPRLEIDIVAPQQSGPDRMEVFTPPNGNYGFAKGVQPTASVLANKLADWRANIWAFHTKRRTPIHAYADIRSQRLGKRYPQTNQGTKAKIDRRFPPVYLRALGTDKYADELAASAAQNQPTANPPVQVQQVPPVKQSDQGVPTKSASSDPPASPGTSVSSDPPASPGLPASSGSQANPSEISTTSASDKPLGPTSITEVLLVRKPDEQLDKREPSPDDVTVKETKKEDFERDPKNYVLLELKLRSTEFLAFTRDLVPIPMSAREFSKMRFKMGEKIEDNAIPVFSREDTKAWDRRREFLASQFRIEALLGQPYKNRFPFELNYRGVEPYDLHLVYEASDNVAKRSLSGSLAKLGKENYDLFRALESHVLNMVALDELCTQLQLMLDIRDRHPIPGKPSFQFIRYQDAMFGSIPYIMFGEARKMVGLPSIGDYEKQGHATWRKLEYEFHSNLKTFNFYELQCVPDSDGVPKLSTVVMNLVGYRDTPLNLVTHTTMCKEIQSFYGTGTKHELNCPTEPMGWLQNGYIYKDEYPQIGASIAFDSATSDDSSDDESSESDTTNSSTTTKTSEESADKESSAQSSRSATPTPETGEKSENEGSPKPKRADLKDTPGDKESQD